MKKWQPLSSRFKDIVRVTGWDARDGGKRCDERMVGCYKDGDWIEVVG